MALAVLWATPTLSRMRRLVRLRPLRANGSCATPEGERSDSAEIHLRRCAMSKQSAQATRRMA
jgi:hypothetical protein